MDLETYSHNFISFVTHEYFQQARVLDCYRPEKLAGDKHSNLLGTFLSYQENKVL
jgi:hypothetical protein